MRAAGSGKREARGSCRLWVGHQAWVGMLISKTNCHFKRGELPYGCLQLAPAGMSGCARHRNW